MRYVLAPYLKTSRHLQIPDKIEPGLEAVGRLWWFGVIPAWRHHIKVLRLDLLEIYTNEWGGPVRTWNHRLNFIPTGDHSCSYTDEIEVDDGVRGWGTRLFVRDVSSQTQTLANPGAHPRRNAGREQHAIAAVRCGELQWHTSQAMPSPSRSRADR
jgi:hypothetical protein